MAKTRLYLDMRGKAKDGKGSVMILLSHNRTSTTFPTGIRVLPSNWNGSSVIRLHNQESINISLLDKKRQIDKYIEQISISDTFQYMTASQIKHDIESKNRTYDVCLVKDLFEEYISLGMKHGTEVIYRLTLKKVLAFGGNDIMINDIDYRWLLQFDRYLSKTQGVNGRSIYLRALRAICNYSLKIGITLNYPFRMFSIKSENTIKRCISVNKLRQIRNIADKKCKDCIYIDYFFLIFYLIGINVKDLLLAKKSQIQNDRLEYIREKTGKKYSIHIEHEASEIFSKYSGSGEYLLNAMDHCIHYQSFARQINEGLKRATDIPGITTYYARHSWATIAYEIGISIDTISQALGHSFGNRTTLIYVKQDQSKVDEANRRVIDYLNGQIIRSTRMSDSTP